MTTRPFSPALSFRPPTLLRWLLWAVAVLMPGSLAIAVAIGLFRLIRQEMTKCDS